MISAVLPRVWLKFELNLLVFESELVLLFTLELFKKLFDWSSCSFSSELPLLTFFSKSVFIFLTVKLFSCLFSNRDSLCKANLGSFMNFELWLLTRFLSLFSLSKSFFCPLISRIIKIGTRVDISCCQSQHLANKILHFLALKHKIKFYVSTNKWIMVKPWIKNQPSPAHIKTYELGFASYIYGPCLDESWGNFFRLSSTDIERESSLCFLSSVNFAISCVVSLKFVRGMAFFDVKIFDKWTCLLRFLMFLCFRLCLAIWYSRDRSGSDK